MSISHSFAVQVTVPTHSVNWYILEFGAVPGRSPSGADAEPSEPRQLLRHEYDALIGKEVVVIAGEHKGLFGWIRGASESKIVVAFEAKGGQEFSIKKREAILM